MYLIGGLGHASRSSVLIQRLIQEGHDVTIASDGVALTHLKKRFPDQSFLELPAYNVRYASRSMTINMVFQARKNPSSDQKGTTCCLGLL